MEEFDSQRREENRERVLHAVFEELRRAKEKFPGWPEDVVHGAAVVAEEAGELVRASLDLYYERGKKEEVIKEAIHTTAMGLRFLFNFDKDA